ncbi:MAG: hypothetical protein ACREKE_00815 [bacterium]
MPNFLLDWLAAGMVFDLLFLGQVHLMKSGKAGSQLKALYHDKTRRSGETAAFIIPAAIGFVFWPYMLAGLFYFCVRVKQERDKQREYGRLPSKRETKRVPSQRGGNY